MTLDLSEVKKIAVQCGAYVWKENVDVHASAISYYAAGDSMFNEKQLALFSQAIYAMGAAEERERIASLEYLHLTDGQKSAIRSQE